MNTHQQELWTRLCAFDIDGDDPDFTFSARLARENGWTLEFAQRVIDEYKKFVFLALESGYPVTPSEHVDQAWHLHLTYTRSYWDRMCNEVLGRPLHHNPTRGGDAEKDKFDDWYAKTKQSYQRVFDEPAPEDIWPPHEKRFGTDLRWKRVNLAHYWVLRRPRPATVLGVGSVSALAIALVGCSGDPNGGPLPIATRGWMLAISSLLLLGATGVTLWHGISKHRTPDMGERAINMFVAFFFLLGSILAIPAMMDRWHLPDLGIAQSRNDLMLILAGISVGIALLVLLIRHGGGGDGGGWFGGCGGGLGGCGGGCGGGGCGGCGG